LSTYSKHALSSSKKEDAGGDDGDDDKSVRSLEFGGPAGGRKEEKRKELKRKWGEIKPESVEP
jgi:hypothetical protein